MLITARNFSIFLGLALSAFAISTIVLAVQKANLKHDLNDARDKLDQFEEALKTTTTTAAPGPTDPTPTEPIDYRLPTALKPIHYNLYLHPDVATGNFSGQVRITIYTAEMTDLIKLHSLHLAIRSVYLADGGSETLYVKRFDFDTEPEFLVIELSAPIPKNTTFILGITFEGTMTGKIVGLYRSSYIKPEGKKMIASSKFEPTFARQAFPCFDEPAMKATFEFTLVRPTSGGYHALSNMNAEFETYQGNYTEVHFNKSVAMSTYLACFLISDFDHKSTYINTEGIGEKFALRVFTTPEQIDKVDFALTVGKAIIEYYIQYFQIAYPLPKLDMAAIPDFVSGAMEHWGLVTYRQTSLLYDEAVSSTANKQRIAGVIAHEFAHMWFGNLVTMMWWNDLWLNEGFANYIQDKGIGSVFPEWKMQDQFIIATLHGVLSLDATLGAHPIIQPVRNPDQITEIFDTITYSKGASIIRMLEDFLGEKNFQLAVKNYLNLYKYSNAVTDDFFHEIDKLGLEINVTTIMRTWTEQMGLPVVNVVPMSETVFKLTQKRFFSNPHDYESNYTDSPFNYTWSIPITYRTSVSPRVERAWFYSDQEEIMITLPTAVEWIKFNFEQIGYYRVNYPKSMWENLAEKLLDNPNVFSIGDRACLLNDVFTLADATQLSYDVALDMTKYLQKETDYVPWSVSASKLTTLNRNLMFTDTFLDFNKYAKELIGHIYESVTWIVGNDHLKNRLRVTILSSSCSLGLTDCLLEASARFEEWLKTPAVRPHPDIRETVYYYGMQHNGSEQAWDRLWQIFLAEDDASEKSKLMYGLSGVQSPWILSRYVDLAWNESYIRSQDYFTCLENIAANPIGEPIVWDYVRENWSHFVDRFGLNERYLGNMIPSITARFSTQTKLEEMESFFRKYPDGGAGTAARIRALENVKNNIAWLQNNRVYITDWLKQQSVNQLKAAVHNSKFNQNLISTGL